MPRSRWVAGEDSQPAPLGWLAAVGVLLTLALTALVGFALASPDRAHRLGDTASSIISRARRALGRAPVSWNGDTLLPVRQEVLRLLRRRWIALTITTLANQLTGYLMLDLSLRAVGIPLSQLSAAETFAAWSIGRLLGSLPITPGGIGIVEIGLVGTLVSFGGGRAPVVAGVLLYRLLVITPTLALGALAGITWKLRR